MLASGVPTDGAFGTIVQCMRFIDCQMEYAAPQLTLLLRGLQDNLCPPRQAFFAAVCASRRRVQSGWATRSVARIFGLEHELCILRQLSAMIRIRMLLAQRHLSLLDAFRAFNAGQNGLLTCSELYGALVWLGLPVSPPDVYNMVRYMDRDADGLITYDEFRTCIGMGVDDFEEAAESAAIVSGTANDSEERADFDGLHPIPIPELAEVDAEQEEADAAPTVPTELLGQIKVKVKKLDKFDEIWRSSGIATKHKTSIWEDKISKSLKLVGGRNRMRVTLGHFGSASYSAPRGDRYTLEMTDLTLNSVQQSKWLPLATKQCMPHPLRFHRVWAIQTGSQPLFVWEPVPPSDEFVALGMVATSTEEPPPVRLVR